MTEFCIVCLTELGCTDPSGWFYNETTTEAFCPWCLKDLLKIRDLIKDVPMMVTHEEFTNIVREMTVE